MMVATEEGLALALTSGMLLGALIAMAMFCVRDYVQSRRRRADYDPHQHPDNWG